MSPLADALQGAAPRPPAGIVAARLRGGEVEVEVAAAWIRRSRWRRPSRSRSPRAHDAGPIKAGLGWMCSPLARGTGLWWHNGGTHGSRSFTGFAPATGAAVAVLTNSPKAPDGLARRS